MSEEQPSGGAKVVMVTNHKGGCGKTSNTLALAAALAQKGRQCLLIDLDGEPNLTEMLGAPTFEGWPSSYEFITQSEDDPVGYDATDYVITDENEEVKLPKGMHLIPGAERIENLHDWWLSRKSIIFQHALRKPLEALKGSYDYIFVDTPPRTSDATIAAMFAVDFVIFSTFPQPPAVKKVASALADLQETQIRGQVNAKPLGIVLCAVRRPPTRLTRYLTNELEEQFLFADGSPMKFSREVDYAVSFDEAWLSGQTIFDYESTHKCCAQYLEIAEEMEARIAAYNNLEVVVQPAQRPADAGVPDPEEVAANE